MFTQSLAGKSFLALLVCCLVGIVSAGQQTPVAVDKKPYLATGNEGKLAGTVSLTGKRPVRRQIDMSADPVCEQVSTDPYTDLFRGKDNMLANVFVYVKSEALETYQFEMPDQPAVLEHKGCSYAPRALGMRVNQPLIIVNSDATIHNIHPYTKVNPEWNQTQPNGAPPLTKYFKRAEMFIPFRCNQHPWEQAYLGVFAHPFFAVTDELGNYRIEGLPPGRYTLVAWHEKLGEQTLEITVAGRETRDLNFTFDASSISTNENKRRSAE